jgi:hypothetical protein
MKLNQIFQDNGMNIDLLSKGARNVIISLNGKVLVIYSKKAIYFYDIKYN